MAPFPGADTGSRYVGPAQERVLWCGTRLRGPWNTNGQRWRGAEGTRGSLLRRARGCSGNTVNENSAGADERARFAQMERVCKTQLVDS